MSSSTTIDAIIDTIKARLEANASTLCGETETLTFAEKDENPAVIAEEHQLPRILIIPLMGKGDVVGMTFPSSVMSHDLVITILGYYKANDIDTALRTVRGYAYTCLDLFSGTGQKVGAGNIIGGKLEVGYFITSSAIIHYFLWEFRIKAMF